MNLREEISIQLENMGYFPEEKSTKEFQRRFVELFKKWALEMVGEDFDLSAKGSDWEDSTPEDNDYQNGFNEALEIIRQRIEETK